MPAVCCLPDSGAPDSWPSSRPFHREQRAAGLPGSTASACHAANQPVEHWILSAVGLVHSGRHQPTTGVRGVHAPPPAGGAAPPPPQDVRWPEGTSEATRATPKRCCGVCRRLGDHRQGHRREQGHQLGEEAPGLEERPRAEQAQHLHPGPEAPVERRCRRGRHLGRARSCSGDV
jgi:hypothetical protein